MNDAKKKTRMIMEKKNKKKMRMIMRKERKIRGEVEAGEGEGGGLG